MTRKRSSVRVAGDNGAQRAAVEFLKRHPKMSLQHQRRLDQLLDKQQAEGLTRAEQRELKLLITSGNNASEQMLKRALRFSRAPLNQTSSKKTTSITNLSA